MSATTELRIQLLGSFRVLVGDRAVPSEAWRGRRASALVKLLALAPAFRLPREQIADVLWPDFDLDAQLNNLNVAASRARSALTVSGATTGAFLTRDGDALVLGPAETVLVDVTAFERGVAAGWHSLDPAVCRAALALYAGDLLPDDVYDEWVVSRRAALRTQFLALLARVAHLHEERGEHGYAVEAWQRLVAMEPADEAASVGLMRLYDLLGQRQQALAQYDQLVANLRGHVDAEPQRETVELARTLREAGPPVIDPLAQPSTPRQANDAALQSVLPLPLDELVGREREIAEVRARLEQGRLVTLTGAGGIGKTRLALAVAHERELTQGGELTDGVVFVDLAPVVVPNDVLAAIAQAVQPGQTGEPSLTALAGALAPRRTLLVLDNFEQVIDAAPVVTALLERARGCRVLVTSRVPLRVRGEIEYPVPPLSAPGAETVGDAATLLRFPAVALFAQRARDASPDFAVTADNGSAVGAICRLLDGLPLAIELAAARIKVLSPATMLGRLDRPLALLVGGARDLPRRQQTIRDTIAWSHDLLSPAEQRLFRRLGVFIGGWSLESAEAVVDTDGGLGIAVLDGLASLVDKSLVVRRDDDDGDPWFALREPVREFAAERLAASADEPLVRDRHAAFAVALAERAAPHLEGGELPRWMRRLDRDDANLRAALRWLTDRRDAEPALRLLTALRLYHFIRGRLAEGCEDLLAVAAMPEAEACPDRRVDALIGAAFFAREYGDYDRAAVAAADARAAADRIGDLARQADALVNLGYVALQRGDRRTARDTFGEALRLHRDLGNDQGIADALSFLGLTATYAGDLAEARRLNEESLAIWERLRDRQAVVWARTRLGSVLARQGDAQGAAAEFVASLAIARELDFRWGYAWALDGLAGLAADRGERELAVELATAAADVRAASALRLPPTEQTEVARLHAELGITTNANADESVATGSLPQRLAAAVERARRSFTARPASTPERSA